MYKLLFVSILAFWMTNVHSQVSVKGRVTYQNSGDEPVYPAQVGAPGATSTSTDSKGNFTLDFLYNSPGDIVKIYIDKPGYEVVNKEALNLTIPSEKNGFSYTSFYLCPVGQWEANAMKYYKISEEVITEEYERKITDLKQQFTANEELLRDTLKELSTAYVNTLNNIWEVAERFAKTNLDEATDLHKKAMMCFVGGKVDSALIILNEKVIFDRIEENRRVIDNAKIIEDLTKKDLATEINSLLLKCDIYGAKLDFENKERVLEELVIIEPENYRVNMSYAVMMHGKSDYATAEGHYQRALLHASSKLDSIECLVNLGTLESNRDNADSAMIYFQSAMDIFSSVDIDDLDSRWLALQLQVHKLIAIGLQKRSQPLLAIDTLGYALKLVSNRSSFNDNYEATVDLQNGIAQVHTMLANVFSTIGSDSLAILHYNTALDIYTELVESEGRLDFQDNLALVDYNLAIAYHYLDSVTLAQELFEKSIKQRRDLLSKSFYPHANDLAYSLTTYGTILMGDKSSVDQSIILLREAVVIREKLRRVNPLGFRDELANAYNMLGSAFGNKLELDSADIYINKSYSLQKELADQFTGRNAYENSLATSAGNLGILNYFRWSSEPDSAKAQRAVSFLREAISIFEKYPNNRESKPTIRAILPYLERLEAWLVFRKLRTITDYREKTLLSDTLIEKYSFIIDTDSDLNVIDTTDYNEYLKEAFYINTFSNIYLGNIAEASNSLADFMDRFSTSTETERLYFLIQVVDGEYMTALDRYKDLYDLKSLSNQDLQVTIDDLEVLYSNRKYRGKSRVLRELSKMVDGSN